jgi:hypothetical protein
MIVSHAHRFVFVAIPKTGTHAVRQALRAHLADGDMEQAGLMVKKQFPIAELAAIGHGHIGLAQLRPFLPQEQFASYLKFAFVRNPFDRFVSYCAFATRETGEFSQRPREVMRRVLFEIRPLKHVLFWPQHVFLTDEQGALLSDRVGRTEAMQQDHDDICTRLGLPSTQLERVNSSQRGDYRQYYDAPLIDAVATLYRRDLELFDYEFDGPR